MKNGLRSAGIILAVLVHFCCFTTGCKPENIDVALSTTVVSLAVKPATASMAPGSSLQLKALGTLSNNKERDISRDVTWSSADPGIATVSSTGLVTSVPASSGTTTITAVSGEFSGDAVLTFSPVASMNVTPADSSIAPGTSQQFTATAVLQNGTTQDVTTNVAWNSSEPVMTVNESGLVSSNSLMTGASTITAVFGSVTGTAQIMSSAVRSIEISPFNISMIRGATRQFTATGTLSDSNTQNLTHFATWTSSDNGVSIVSSTGLAAAVAPGSALITASFGNASGSALVSVSVPALVSLTITPGDLSIALGSSQQFTALGIFSDGTQQDMTSEVAWISSNSQVASISNVPGTEGLTAPLSAGTARITATFSNITSNATVLTVTPAASTVLLRITPANPFMVLGNTIQFTASRVASNGTVLEDLTSTAFWSSSNASVAFVSQGFVTALGAGTTTITATFGAGSASTILTVTAF